MIVNIMRIMQVINKVIYLQGHETYIASQLKFCIEYAGLIKISLVL